MRAIPRGAAVVGCVLAAGCSLILSTAEPEQCTSNRDCDANPSLRDRVCEQGFCVVPKAPIVAVSNDAGEGCVSTELCTQGNSNKASVCKKAGGACTPWQTARCPIISGAWNDPNALVIGSILPLTVRQADGRLAPLPYFQRIQRAIDLGLDEFATAIPGGIVFPGSVRRPLAVLHCDSSFTAAGALEAWMHLTTVVGTETVIIGGDEELVSVSADATTRKTAIVCTDCNGPLPQGPLAWRIMPPIALEAPMAAWRVSELETVIRARPSPPTSIKVAVLQEQPARGAAAFVDTLVAKLRFNGGKTALQNGASFTVRKTENPLVESVNIVGHADAIVAFEPDVLVVAMGGDFPAHYLPLIEAKWPAGKPKPFYVMTNLNFELTPFALVAPPIDDDLRVRLSGTRPAFSQALQDNIDGFSIRYKQAYNFKPPDGSHSGYDAIYSMAYAIAAASAQPLLDGPHISAGFERLRSGTMIDYGPGPINLATALLGQPAATIDARGLWSPLDWNLSTRDLETDVSMYCFERQNSNLALKPDVGVRLTTSTGQVSGTYACN